MFCCCSRNNSQEKMSVTACYDEVGNPQLKAKEKSFVYSLDVVFEICVIITASEAHWHVRGRGC